MLYFLSLYNCHQRLIDIALLEYGALMEFLKNRRNVNRQKAARKSTL